MILEFTVQSNLFSKMMQDNGNWYRDYYRWLFLRVIEELGNEKIKYFLFYYHALAVQDNEFILKAFGNLDADL